MNDEELDLTPYCVEGCGREATSSRIITRYEEGAITTLGYTDGPVEIVELVCDLHSLNL